MAAPNAQAPQESGPGKGSQPTPQESAGKSSQPLSAAERVIAEASQKNLELLKEAKEKNANIRNTMISAGILEMRRLITEAIGKQKDEQWTWHWPLVELGGTLKHFDYWPEVCKAFTSDEACLKVSTFCEGTMSYHAVEYSVKRPK